MAMTTKRFESRQFDTRTADGIKAAERYQMRLYSKYERVTVKAVGLDRVVVIGSN